MQNLTPREVTNRARLIVKRERFSKGFRILFSLLQKSILDFAFWGKNSSSTNSAAKPLNASTGKGLQSRFEKH
jgi:hypothetical protein